VPRKPVASRPVAGLRRAKCAKYAHADAAYNRAGSQDVIVTRQDPVGP